MRLVGSILPIALVRDPRIDRTLGDPLGFMWKILGKDGAGSGSKVIGLGEWSGFFEKRSVTGKYSGIWSSGGSDSCETVFKLYLALEACHPHW